MDTLEQIKRWANNGWNQDDTAEALGISRYKLQVFLRQYPEFTWPLGRSIAQRERARTGKPEWSPRLQADRYKSLPRYTIRGMTGTRKELIEMFAVVPRHTVDVRITRGWTLEQAIFTPRRSRPAAVHPWREP